jgi:excisionase family DNA binding protein
MSNDTTISDGVAWPLLSIAQTANLAGVSADTIRRAVSSGSLTAYKIRGCVRIRMTDLEDWITKCRYRVGEAVTHGVEVPASTDYRW